MHLIVRIDTDTMASVLFALVKTDLEMTVANTRTELGLEMDWNFSMVFALHYQLLLITMVA